MSKRIKPIRRLVSIHEAGQAVAAVALNVGIERVNIHLDGVLTKGACWLATEPEPVGKLDEVHTLIDAAGEVAVELFHRGGSNEIERHLGPSALRRAHDAYAKIGLTFSPERDLPKGDGEHLGDAVALLNHETPAYSALSKDVFKAAGQNIANVTPLFGGKGPEGRSEKDYNAKELEAYKLLQSALTTVDNDGKIADDKRADDKVQRERDATQRIVEIKRAEIEQVAAFEASAQEKSLRRQGKGIESAMVAIRARYESEIRMQDARI